MTEAVLRAQLVALADAARKGLEAMTPFVSNPAFSLQPFLPCAHYVQLGFERRTDEARTPTPVDVALELAMLRQPFRRDFGYVLVSDEVMEGLAAALRPRGPMLDVGCGSGYLAAELKRRGLSTYAVDSVDPSGRREPSLGYPVRARFQLDTVGNAATFVDPRFGSVLLTWPLLGRPMALEVASAMLPGQWLVFEGEPEGGCTADGAFYQWMNDASAWQPLPEVAASLNAAHVTWPTLNDSWHVWERLPSSP